METKVCTSCELEKDLSEFYSCKGGKYGKRADCIDCYKIKKHEYNVKNKDRILEKGRKYYHKLKKNNPDVLKKRKRRSGWLVQKIDCDDELFNEMLNQQQGCCAICGVHQSKLKRALDVDHSHKTGKVRKLLCSKCNMGLGCFDVDERGESLLLKAIEYVKDNEVQGGMMLKFNTLNERNLV